MVDTLGYYDLQTLWMVTRDEKDNASLFHEYIHFMQNILHASGLASLIIHAQAVQDAVNQHKNLSTFPIILSDIVVDNWDRLYGKYEGDTEHDPGDTDYSEINIGRYIIQESMAHEIERHIFDTNDVPEFPYKIVRRYLEGSVSCWNAWTHEKQMRILVVVCDVALNFFDAGQVLRELVDKYEWANLNDPADIYDTLSDCKVTLDKSIDPSGKEMTTRDAHEFIAEAARKALMSIFPGDGFERLRKVLSQLLNNAKTFVSQRPRAFYELVCSPAHDLWVKYEKELGAPIILQGQGWHTSKNYPNIETWELACLRGSGAILSVLVELEGNAGCSILECPDRVPICNSRPWEYSKLCPFRRMWQVYGCILPNQNTK